MACRVGVGHFLACVYECVFFFPASDPFCKGMPLKLVPTANISPHARAPVTTRAWTLPPLSHLTRVYSFDLQSHYLTLTSMILPWVHSQESPLCWSLPSTETHPDSAAHSSIHSLMHDWPIISDQRSAMWSRGKHTTTPPLWPVRSYRPIKSALPDMGRGSRGGKSAGDSVFL